MASTNNFQQDRTSECILCLEPLETTSNSTSNSTSESNSSQKIITLRCGHRYHKGCIIDQIEAGRNAIARNDDQRILFNSFQCAMCATVIRAEDHEGELPGDLFRASDDLRSRVDELIEEHGLRGEVERELMKRRRGGERKKASRETLDREIMRRYAFYRCSNASCGEPFFGGTIECADAFRTETGNGSSNMNGNTNSNSNSNTNTSKLCPACAPQPQSVCRNPSRHAGYLTWKCRYCCRPATYLCYGNVHFCDSCHEKNSTKKDDEVVEPIPCPGASCPHPKPEPGARFHSNGPAEGCEQVYSCAICSESDGNDPTRIPPGSRNFVENPCGGSGLEGWRRVSVPRRNRWENRTWEVEALPTACFAPVFPTPALPPAGAGRREFGFEFDHPDPQPIATNFVSSYYWCVMGQSIDLSKFLRLNEKPKAAPTNNSESTASPAVRIEVSARYTQRTGIPSFFQLDAVLCDGRSEGSVEVERKSTGTLRTDVLWERCSLVFDLGTLEEIGSRFGDAPVLTVVVSGKDDKYWAGPYGSKVTDICVRVLGRTPEEIDALVRSSMESNHGMEWNRIE